MSQYADLLVELFDSPRDDIHELSKEEIDDQPYFFSLDAAYRFSANGKKYFVLFIRNRDYVGDYFEFSFAKEGVRKSSHDGLSYDPTGDGGTGIEVYSKVGEALRRFIDSRSPDGLIFGGQSPRQKKLYERIFGRITSGDYSLYGLEREMMAFAKLEPKWREY